VSESNGNGGGKFGYLLVGLGLGALLGMLFAPQSGEETREYILDRAEEGKEYAQDMAKELRDRAEKLMERSKQILAQQAGSLNAAVEAGKEAYREKAKV